MNAAALPSTCPRCGNPVVPERIGKAEMLGRCMWGPLGSPCAEQLLRAAPARELHGIPDTSEQSDRGLALERELRRACDEYGRRGRAHVRKLLTSSVGERHQEGLLGDRAPEFRYAKHGYPDFEGFLMPSGFFCRFEAKATKHERLPLSRVSSSQRKRLDQAAVTQHAHVGLVVRLNENTRDEATWWAPWRDVRLGFTSLTAADLDRLGRRLPSAQLGAGKACLWLD